jgi:signal transduction histidine kinase
VAGHLTMAGSWPRGVSAVAADGAGPRTLPVRYGDQVLGALRLQERPGLPLTAVAERLYVDLASQAGLVLRLVGLRAELESRHHELRARTHELETSRARLIEAQDSERRRLEHDIHDGAQQHLVALAVNLQLVGVVAARAPGRAHHLLAVQAEAARVAIDTLSSLSRGIYPRLLSEHGLVAALRSAVAVSPVPVTVVAEDSGRPEPLLEVALYFCCMEAVQNAVKHSGAGRVTVTLGHDDGRWCLEVTDDGSGFDQTGALAVDAGVGLMNMRDRLDAVGGSVSITSAAGSGTTVSAVGPTSRGGG